MSDSYAIVVTTINKPTSALIDIARLSHRLDAVFHVIGDAKSPPGFSLAKSRYLDVEAQKQTEFTFARLCPLGHYARKNIGYLAAARDGATIIIETDDDNIPLDAFWAPRNRLQRAYLMKKGGWCNVYAYFSDQLIWPRGLPLSAVRDQTEAIKNAQLVEIDCPIQQGLADENPDVDAIYRLILPLPVKFKTGHAVALSKGTWCPFNSQNTTFWREAFPLLYLPYYCSFRMTDIWRSFVAQRLMWENNWFLQFHGSTVYQERNEHDLMLDLADEVPGYLHNDRIRKSLEDLSLSSGVNALPDNLIKAYELLIGLGLVDSKERGLVAAWLEDLSRL